MAQNVELITKNISTAEELESQSRDLLSNAEAFKSHSVQLKRNFWWKNVKVCFYFFIFKKKVSLLIL